MHGPWLVRDNCDDGDDDGGGDTDDGVDGETPDVLVTNTSAQAHA